ncbi:Rho GTPase-activating protein 7-like Protein [Tribolium castaneum]|uniref:Rho GTPase-activating protein 7-like Protein n=1 Tax=Tribolium castaneum TaxID=7070 RepID=D6W7Z5_TRICA|nr:PREDICTED: stAR-related lipid transfer protein 13 [Tribolium castaneum]EFA11023.2 Rho GTPase-activating protein 7-like Protein [Tribolium castaneum]|eukprot:XP_008200699.1 PREDICTED: stAR-related lipid transfer protein 13 [Tribolium castaneum]
MSLYDPYQELELYLERAKNEITQVFENGTDEPAKNPVPEEDIIKNENKTDYELDPFLFQFNATIKSDLSELLSRYSEKQTGNEVNYTSVNNIVNSNTDYLNSNVENLSILNKDSDLCNRYGEEKKNVNQDSLLGSIAIGDYSHTNVATQTSPSLSPTSTNLTWASECSSSPCLTCMSDNDLIDDDSHSASSADGKGQLSTWSYKPNWHQILSTKSSSAPVLKKVPIKVSKQSRSQSDRHLAEIEAAEACKWLRATGFPQYAQMYEDLQFPIDLSTVAQDHPLLEPDVLHSLFRRLQILNSCVHLHQQRIAHNTDESEDECCALSDNWTYQTDIRRWSRACKNQPEPEKNSQEKDDVFEQYTESPRDKLRRAGSTKFRRRRRDGTIFSEGGSPQLDRLDSLTHQLADLKTCELNHVSDSECTPKRNQRTKSFDNTDSWLTSQISSDDRVLWHALPQEEEQSPQKTVNLENGGPSMFSLSCTQLQVLRKLALLKLTAHMEKHCPSHRTGWNWDLPKFIRKMKTPAYKDRSIFGVPLTIMLQRTGQSIPRNIEEALQWLHQNAADHVGLFRKSGVKSRIQILRNMVDATTEILNYNDQQSYDVADMIKQYFRELPETLLTNKLSETFILIFQYVPPYLRRESVLCAILLMPDEHVEVLQFLLHFLLQIAEHATTNQMNESNLALCFAPSLFHYSQSSFKQNFGSPHPKELAETRAGHDCLLYFLKNYNALFKVPKEFVNQCKTSEFRESKAVKLSELGKNIGGWREYLQECQMALLREVKERNRGWIVVSGHNPRVEVSYKKVADGHPLRLWKVSAEVEAPPLEVLHRIIRERHLWDPELHSAKIVSQIDKNCEVFQYVRRKIVPLPNEEYCVVRTWRTDLPKDSCLVIETSVEHQDAVPIPNTVRGIVLASRYLIEPCGSGRSKLLHLSRVDSMGKTPEWYQKNYGHICALFVANIVSSFYHVAAGPESKV